MTTPRIWIVLVASILLVRVPASTQAPDSRPARLTGVVLAADTAAPIPGATLQIVGRDETATSDADGRFEFQALPPGTYLLRGEAGGYVPTSAGQQHVGDAPDPVVLRAGSAAHVELHLLPLGRLSGLLLDEAGGPVHGAVVHVIRRGELGPFGKETATDEHGRFGVRALPTGQYYVSAYTRVAPREAGGDGRDAFAALTHFPGTAYPEQAATVSVAPGAEAHVTFTLARSPVARVSGTVLDATGQPARRFALIPIAEPPIPPAAVPVGMNLDDGRFELTGLPPGTYHLMFLAREALAETRRTGGGPAGDFAGARVHVRDDDVEDLTVVMGRGFTVTGRLIDPSGRPFELGGVLVRAASAWPQTISPLFGERSAPTAQDGTFVLRDLLGTYMLRIDELPQWMALRLKTGRQLGAVERVVVDGVDVTDAGVEIVGDTRVEVVIGPSTWLEGTVVSRQGVAVPDAWVAIFSEDPNTWELPHSRYVRTLRVTGDGEFQVFGLPHGRYFVAAVRGLMDGRPGADQLSLLMTQATRLELTGPETRTITLPID